MNPKLEFAGVVTAWQFPRLLEGRQPSNELYFLLTGRGQPQQAKRKQSKRGDADI